MTKQIPQKLPGVGVSEKIFNKNIVAGNSTNVKQLDRQIFSLSNNSHSKLFSLEEIFQAIVRGEIARDALPLLSELFSYSLENSHINESGEVII